MAKSGSVSWQVKNALNSKSQFGLSRHDTKIEMDGKSPYIHSCKTYETYFKQGVRFMKWAKENYNIKTLEQAHTHVSAYIKWMKQQGWSPHTQHTCVAAICKIYGTKSTDYERCDTRSRSGVTRSRGAKSSDKNFNENHHRELVDFCKGTGLRRSEVENLRPNFKAAIKGQNIILNQLEKDAQGVWVLRNVRGKGGRIRDIPLGDNAEQIAARIMETPDGCLVFPAGINTHADIHSYRADYANRFYQKEYYKHYGQLSPKEIPREDRYICRGDMHGLIYSKKCMRVVSDALGHGRVCVMAYSYLR